MPYAERIAQRAAEARYRARNRLENHIVRRLRRRAPGAQLSIHDVRALLLSEPSCAYCGGAADHAEHCTPLARGGSGELDNLVMACADCNLKKGCQTVLEFFGLWPAETPF